MFTRKRPNVISILSSIAAETKAKNAKADPFRSTIEVANLRL